MGCQVTTRTWLSFSLLSQCQPRADWTLIWQVSTFYTKFMGICFNHTLRSWRNSQNICCLGVFLVCLLLCFCFVLVGWVFFFLFGWLVLFGFFWFGVVGVFCQLPFINFASASAALFSACFLVWNMHLKHFPPIPNTAEKHLWQDTEELPLQTSLFAYWFFFSKTFEGLAEDVALKNRTPAPFAAVLVLPSLCWTAEVQPRSHTKLP